MSDDRENRERPESDRISFGEEREVHYWTRALGASEEELREAVQFVGNREPKVREYLRRHQSARQG